MQNVISQYEVRADRETGAWLGSPELVGKVSVADWCKMHDTEDVHYDTFEKPTEDAISGETCAIAVTFVA